MAMMFQCQTDINKWKKNNYYLYMNKTNAPSIANMKVCLQFLNYSDTL